VFIVPTSAPLAKPKMIGISKNMSPEIKSAQVVIDVKVINTRGMVFLPFLSY